MQYIIIGVLYEKGECNVDMIFETAFFPGPGEVRHEIKSALMDLVIIKLVEISFEKPIPGFKLSIR